MTELNFPRAQDRHLSLWQSAVAETLHGELDAEGSPTATLAGSDHPLAVGVHAHVEGALAGTPPAEPSGAAEGPALLGYLSRLGLEKGHALVEGDADRAALADAAFRPFSDSDPGFAKCAVVYAQYYASHGGTIAYNEWHVAGWWNIKYGFIGLILPNNTTDGLIGFSGNRHNKVSI